MRHTNQLIFTTLLILLLSACSSGSSSRYSMRHDAAPLRAPTTLEMQDAIVTETTKSASASRPYTVLGKSYSPMLDETGYSEEGIASWYGRKFHGYHTSNGETYDMFAMTAAHKTLPLPSFVKVTNTANGKSVIVRVNDRGPFHDDRVIDLSYAAAYKLGYYTHGTAKVKLEAVTLAGSAVNQTYIQVAAGSTLTNIEALASTLRSQYKLPTNIVQKDAIYRLHLGPIKDAQHAKEVLQKLKQDQFQNAFLLYTQ
ncbi:septal ring lytic transglycosylase RlpA family protein [Pseudoalteromonas sp. NZS127_1]|uniref:septal ring lytic transglycosylase RlpA family protein n=1 Tax=unclassified Pseudoalteromonas TaxID=194690 RepID=UPI0013FD988B|nr:MULTISPECIES: septal ring lytic transglycosylase RlpA family protein [unclassified Pseudoalteromonas]MBG9996231.1 septal ring lytic transglycosylase RlpA family protein [Pseudoalteromonas sp. NZS127_1]MBH0013930.1 septal ring lytic transglycosylase RlpA family protein [Pseudoalteromonas sp. NZS100_1]MBH0037383.1 septal ring lytic transglycosylase RlpA family protein [Pseudoalteromonas sp. SWN166]MBH0043203.1 septal ring lytic transglycosylase RlpA family protein [Pseudoalteromonas sp. SWXJZ1